MSFKKQAEDRGIFTQSRSPILLDGRPSMDSVCVRAPPAQCAQRIPCPPGFLLPLRQRAHHTRQCRMRGLICERQRGPRSGLTSDDPAAHARSPAKAGPKRAQCRPPWHAWQPGLKQCWWKSPGFAARSYCMHVP